MKTIRFKIEGREIIQLDSTKLIGMVGQDKFVVDFVDDAWQGLHKTMKLIRNDGSIVYLAMLNDEVQLTQECYMEGCAKLGFFGTINENEPENMKIASTDYIDLYFSPHAYSTDSGEAINTPTPTQWDIIIGQMNDILDQANDIKSDVQGIKDDVVNIQSDINNKVDGFDNHVTQKTNEFNANATQKTTTFNNNATSKTTAFNENYTEKVGEVNGIISDFKDYVETVDYNYTNLQNKPQTWGALIGE